MPLVPASCRLPAAKIPSDLCHRLEWIREGEAIRVVAESKSQARLRAVRVERRLVGGYLKTETLRDGDLRESIVEAIVSGIQCVVESFDGRSVR